VDRIRSWRVKEEKEGKKVFATLQIRDFLTEI
jgi:hypothetical protein